VFVLPTTEASDGVLCRGIFFWLGAVLFDQLLFTFTTCGDLEGDDIVE
jgi:hypothetical protein